MDKPPVIKYSKWTCGKQIEDIDLIANEILVNLKLEK